MPLSKLRDRDRKRWARKFEPLKAELLDLKARLTALEEAHACEASQEAAQMIQGPMERLRDRILGRETPGIYESAGRDG